MASRPQGYGMTAELNEKKDKKWDQGLANDVAAWIQCVTAESCPAPSQAEMAETFKNGVILCKLINTIQPGSVRKINDSKMAFKQMENIGNFLAGCEAYGVPKSDLFQTVDLYEAVNMPQVVNGIVALGRKAGSKGYDGPTLGPKESQGNVREFTEEQLKSGQNVIGLQMGSNKGASQAGMSYGKPRQIHDPTQ